MTPILAVRDLVKTYPAFRLDRVGFTLEEGRITGFLGRNGAGKTTTLHLLLGLLRPDGGEICFRGQSLRTHEREIKQRVGFVSAGLSFYRRKKLSAVTNVVRSFYDSWDDAVCRRCMDRFGLDAGKTAEQLSNGMKIKYQLALALSHGADLLILDEPTSGLDPVSREDLLELFLDLRDQGATILFSTHITSDLDKTADRILLLTGGHLRADCSLSELLAAYRLAEYEKSDPAAASPLLIGPRRTRTGLAALVRAEDAAALLLSTRAPTLDEIFVHLEKEEAPCSSNC
ncbi:MAG: ABC transporter ATP-binding protein [Oscillospiraceae bacterium]|nr:ABC transporter ATP-binding protein [Oscillospiraceae bacterium]